MAGTLVMATVASDTAPLGTATGAWVGLLASSLVAVWCLACTIPWRVGSPGLLDSARYAPLITAFAGALAGLAWACSLRAFMTTVAGSASEVTWAGTFGFVRLPGAVIGALLLDAGRRRRSGVLRHRRWLLWSPLLFGAVLLRNPADLLSGGATGLSALPVPAMGMVGGYALAGRGPRWTRALAGTVLAASVPVWVLVAGDLGEARTFGWSPPPAPGRPSCTGACSAYSHWRRRCRAYPARPRLSRPPSVRRPPPPTHDRACGRHMGWRAPYTLPTVAAVESVSRPPGDDYPHGVHEPPAPTGGRRR